MALRELFLGELQARPDMETVVSPKPMEVRYIASGDGRLEGAVSGTLRWSHFEKEGQVLCRTHRAGLIETDDGASIRFEERGYALRDEKDPSRWTLTGGLRFETQDERYRWLNGSLGVLEAEIDTRAGRAPRYRAFAAVDGDGTA